MTARLSRKQIIKMSDLRDKATRTVLVGAVWGDEGKGSIVDLLVNEAQSLNSDKRTLVLRWQGGNNAGHTIYFIDGNGKLQKFVTHSAPSGITCNADIAIGPQVAFNPIPFIAEIEEAQRRFGYTGRVMISERTGILMDYHKRLDTWEEKERERLFGKKVGSTQSGMGPFYEDNAGRKRIPFAVYVSDEFPSKLREVLELKRTMLEKAGIWHSGYLDELLATHESVREKLAPYAERLEYRLQEYYKNGDNIIAEGAQGPGLDVDMGTIPDTTSSHLLASSFFDLGLPRRDFKVYAVEKAYPTRVGSGVMPTLTTGSFGSETVDKGGEVGATTGRTRRVGYPDWVYVKRNAFLNDIDGTFITRSDVIQDSDVVVCTGYEIDGKRVNEVPLDLSKVKPVYSGRTYNWHLWDGPKNLSKPEPVHEQLKPLREQYVRGGFESLPSDLRDFVIDHDRFIGRPTVGLSIGPTRGEIVRLS